MKQIMIPYEEYLLLEKRDKDYYSLELGFKEISKMYNEVKTKNEKAIEYIEKNMDNFEIPWKTVLYDILKGVDKE